MESMYKKHILELYSEKPYFGELKNKTHEIKLKNPGCNDEIIIQLEIKNNKIIDARFSGNTCFISTISASALLDNVIGKNISVIKKLTKKDIDSFLGIEILSTRVNCELFPLEALKRIKC